MAKSTVLVVDRQESRRKEVVLGLTALEYEVVGAVDADEGRRFEAGLRPDVVVAEAELTPVGPSGAGSGQPFRIALAGEEGSGAPGGAAVVPPGLSPDVVVKRIRTALVGREIGVAADVSLTGLEGDLLHVPVLELIPRLQGVGATGRVLLGDGEIVVETGEVAGASVGSARGVKAFARLARTAAGAFRIVLGGSGAGREVRDDVLSLLALAMEDGPRFDEAAARLPDLASRPRPVIGPAFFATRFNPVQQRILTAAPECETVWDIVDAVPEPDGVVLEEVARLSELGFVAFAPPEVKVRVVTDSTADLPRALAERHDVLVVPASVIVGGEILKDGVDLSSAEFFATLERSGARLVEAKPPTKGEFLAAYRTVVARRDVVSLHPSARLSTTFQHARNAAEEGGEDFARLRGEGVPAVEVVDSMLVSTPLALLALMAARMAARRLAAAEIRTRIEAMRERFHVLFAVDHPEYISRSGRVKGAPGFLGNLLGVKPILGLVEGEIVAVERVRGEANVPPKLVELLRGRVEVGRPVIAGIGHAAAPQAAVRLRSLLQEELKVVELLENEIGPAVGLHVGPGCVGIALFQPSPEELTLVRP